MKKISEIIENAKIFSPTKASSTKISSRWLWSRYRKWSRVCLWLPSNLQLRGWQMFHSWQPEGLQVRGLPEEREQQWQELTVWYLFWMVSYQGRNIFQDFFSCRSKVIGFSVVFVLVLVAWVEELWLKQNLNQFYLNLKEEAEKREQNIFHNSSDILLCSACLCFKNSNLEQCFIL